MSLHKLPTCGEMLVLALWKSIVPGHIIASWIALSQVTMDAAECSMSNYSEDRDKNLRSDYGTVSLRTTRND
jgi:hypothetical protein